MASPVLPVLPRFKGTGTSQGIRHGILGLIMNELYDIMNPMRQRVLVPCGWCGGLYMMSKVMTHLKVCRSRPGGVARRDRWHPQAWVNQTLETFDELIHALPIRAKCTSMENLSTELREALDELDRALGSTKKVKDPGSPGPIGSKPADTSLS